MERMWRNTIGICILVITLTAGCHKDTNTEIGRKLPGKWHSVQVANDNNNNGIMDAAELTPVPDSLTSFYTFASDGSGHYTVYEVNSVVTANFRWWLVNDDRDLRLQVAGYIIVDQIDSITSTTLTLRNKSGNNSQWTIFIKD